MILTRFLLYLPALFIFLIYGTGVWCIFVFAIFIQYWIQYLNKGSRVKVSYNVESLGSSLYLVIAQGTFGRESSLYSFSLVDNYLINLDICSYISPGAYFNILHLWVWWCFGIHWEKFLKRHDVLTTVFSSFMYLVILYFYNWRCGRALRVGTGPYASRHYIIMASNLWLVIDRGFKHDCFFLILSIPASDHSHTLHCFILADSGFIEQDITKSSSYYIAVGNVYLNEVKVISAAAYGICFNFDLYVNFSPIQCEWFSFEIETSVTSS